MHLPTNCYLTDLKCQNQKNIFDNENSYIQYEILINGNSKNLRFSLDYKTDDFINNHKHIIFGLLLNEKFPDEYISYNPQVLNNNLLKNIIQSSIFPITPLDKINNLLKYLHNLQDFEGSEIKFPSDVDDDSIAKKLYFKNYQEMVFYISTLLDQDLIEAVDSTTGSGKSFEGIHLTYLGLSKVIELSENEIQSKNCFIAMSFSKDLNELRESIRSTISETGFKPILIDEIHYDSDITINDALIAEIKKCKFLIADFSEHKHGVYFEAGFALGLKRPVIYMCHKNEFDNSHFDTNHYPHIIYKDIDELKSKLKNKIEAWIK